MSFTMHSGCLTVNPGCLTNSPVPLIMSRGLFTAGSVFLTTGSGCLTTIQGSLNMTSGPLTAGSGSLTVNPGRLTANPGSLTTSSGWVFFAIKGMVLSALYWVTGGVCHFLCLETKKVTKHACRQAGKIQGQKNGSALLSGQRTSDKCGGGVLFGHGR